MNEMKEAAKTRRHKDEANYTAGGVTMEKKQKIYNYYFTFSPLLNGHTQLHIYKHKHTYTNISKYTYIHMYIFMHWHVIA